jgi:hypothetical protein
LIVIPVAVGMAGSHPMINAATVQIKRKGFRFGVIQRAARAAGKHIDRTS